MSRRTHPDDRGLAAVGRVRALRENDSRVGLQLVLAEEAAAGGGTVAPTMRPASSACASGVSTSR